MQKKKTKKMRSELDELKKIKKVNWIESKTDFKLRFQDCWNKIEILFLELNKCKYVLLIYTFLF